MKQLARSGCCSHHGGVCGCSCCDGSSLSAKCAPYYSNCNSGYENVYIPQQAPVLQEQIIIRPTPTSVIKRVSELQTYDTATYIILGTAILSLGTAIVGYFVTKK